jgi:hypothetical protein
MNWAQEALFNEMSFQNVILKARQLGFTTFIQIFMLDACLFNSNIRAGTIAHKLDDAKTIFRDKVKYPYDELPEAIKAARPVIRDSADELMFSNNSSIRVGTSLRSGTLQYLHVSEYGKLCAKYPDKAREVRTGALNTIQSGQVVFIESTAEGQEGHFFELSEAARAKERRGVPLTPLDFKFHFFPWWKSPDYELDPQGVEITDANDRYFTKLTSEHGIHLSDRQKAWYVKKAETQQEDMQREYPSTPGEAFEASVEGAYYGAEIAKAEQQARIGRFPAIVGHPVNTAWDIGVGDYTVIWFFQIIAGRFRMVGYFQNSGEGMPFYLDEMERMARERGWDLRGGQHCLPHDGGVTEWGTGRTREEQMRAKRLKVIVVPKLGLADGINAVRTILPLCDFDAGPTADGLKALKNYRKEWDEERSVWREHPRHDWASHGADGFRTMACRYREARRRRRKKNRHPGTLGPKTNMRQ